MDLDLCGSITEYELLCLNIQWCNPVVIQLHYKKIFTESLFIKYYYPIFFIAIELFSLHHKQDVLVFSPRFKLKSVEM